MKGACVLERRATSSFVAGLLALAACGGSGTPSSPSSPSTLVGTVTDPVGDTVSTSLGGVSPDLVSGTIDISGGNLALTISFAPGTLSPTHTLFNANLDTDENAATGFPSQPGALGVDYFIRGVVPRNSTRATVSHVAGNGSCLAVPCTVVGTSSVTFPTADQVRVTIPLTSLGNDDGRMKFEVIVLQHLTDDTTTETLDRMPDRDRAPGVVR